MKPRKRHDTAFPVTFTLKANGSNVDLSDATVRFHMRQLGRTSLKVDAPCVILDQTTNTGQVRYTFIAADVNTTGTFDIEIEVSFDDGTKATFPSEGYERLRIVDDLDNE